MAALLAGACVWCLVVPSAGRRARSLWGPRGGPGSSTRPRPPPALIAAALTPVAGLVVLGWPAGFVVGLLAAPVARAAFERLESGSVRRRSEQVRRQLPGALDLVTAALDAGRPPGIALKLAAQATPDPLGSDLAAVAHRVSVAGDLRAALADITGPLLPLARALRRADQSGIPVASVIAAAASDIRREHQAARREVARRIGVRTAAPLGLCFLPAFLLIGIVPAVIATAASLPL